MTSYERRALAAACFRMVFAGMAWPGAEGRRKATNATNGDNGVA
jgi:hypothetical protein